MCVCPFQSHTNFVVSHPIWGVKVPAVQPIVEDPFRTTAAGVRENPRSSFPCQGQSAQPVLRLGRGGTGRTKLLIELHEFHVFSYACLKWLGKSTWEHVGSTFLDFCFIFSRMGVHNNPRHIQVGYGQQTLPGAMRIWLWSCTPMPRWGSA